MRVQLPWDNSYEHETARSLFGSNLLVLTWIKGEPLPNQLVDDILRGLRLERETGEELRARRGGLEIKQHVTKWSALMTIRTVLLTWGDSASDVYAAVLLIKARSKYANLMVVLLVVAIVASCGCAPVRRAQIDTKGRTMLSEERSRE